MPSTNDPLAGVAKRTKKRYGWNRDLPDRRDYLYAAPLGRYPAGLPPAVDLRSGCPPVYDQGQLGSCTANAIAGLMEFDRLKEQIADYTPSRLFIYYNERVIEGTVDQDSGAQLRDGVKSVAQIGACPETNWPYDIAQFAAQPSAACYDQAKLDRAVTYLAVAQISNQMKGCIAEGYPFVFGFTVYSSFESQEVASSGVMPMPAPGEQILGGHAVAAVGYDDKRRCFIVRNSWGSDWGDRGYFYMPYEFINSPRYASDFWTIRTVGQ